MKIKDFDTKGNNQDMTGVYITNALESRSAGETYRPVNPLEEQKHYRFQYRSLT